MPSRPFSYESSIMKQLKDEKEKLNLIIFNMKTKKQKYKQQINKECKGLVMSRIQLWFFLNDFIDFKIEKRGYIPHWHTDKE